jgi:hypothetical protein
VTQFDLFRSNIQRCCWLNNTPLSAVNDRGSLIEILISDCIPKLNCKSARQMQCIINQQHREHKDSILPENIYFHTCAGQIPANLKDDKRRIQGGF